MPSLGHLSKMDNRCLHKITEVDKIQDQRESEVLSMSLLGMALMLPRPHVQLRLSGDLAGACGLQISNKIQRLLTVSSFNAGFYLFPRWSF